MFYGGTVEYPKVIGHRHDTGHYTIVVWFNTRGFLATIH